MAPTLNINTPMVAAEVKCPQSTLLAEPLGLIDVFVAPVISRTWVSLRVFVLHHATKSVEDRLRREIFRGNEVDKVALAFLLLQTARQSCPKSTVCGCDLRV